MFIGAAPEASGSVEKGTTFAHFSGLVGRLYSETQGGVLAFPERSVPRLFLMPKGQDIHRINGLFMTVQGDIAGFTEGNQQLAQLRHFREGAANVGGCFQ